MVRIFFLFLTSLFCVFSIQAQCILEGQVIDDTGKPIPYTSIYIPKLKKGSMANINGEYSFTIPCGEYAVQFQSL